MIPNDIFSLLRDDKSQEALAQVEEHISANPRDDNAYYVLGRIYWQLGNHAMAVNNYRMAIDINPQSPARYALEIAGDVFDFFNPDLLNP